MRRVYGPYDRGERYADKRYRVAIVDGRGKTRTTVYETFASWADAERAVQHTSDQTQGTTVREAVDAYLDDARDRGLVASTIQRYESHLWRLLDVERNGNRPVRWLQGRGAELYRASVRGASDTHINGLHMGKMFAGFCVERGMLRMNPFDAVKPKGRKRKGSTKPRLSIDESRKLETYCLEHGDDPACVLTYGYLMLGKRASELARVRVRDLDDDGWRLRITEAKTEAGVGDLPLSPQLREMLQGLAAARVVLSASSKSIGGHRDVGKTTGDAGLTTPAADTFLFVREDGAPLSRYGARDRVLAVTKAAIGRAVTPQELRRTFVDNATRQGFALRTIAEQTGHASPTVTVRSYMSKAAADAGAVERNFKVYAGGKR